MADTLKTNSFIRESKKAYDWLTIEANRRGQTLIFKEHWVTNKNTSLKHNFVHKLPNNSLKVLTRKRYFKVVTRKKTKAEKEKIERVNWEKSLFDSISKQVNDTSLVKLLTHKFDYNRDNKLVMIHLLKVRKSKILGFYQSGRAFIGNNKSVTISHETLHFLGAPDLYTHRYWFGKRRGIVKKELRQEVMDYAIAKNYDCTTYYISNYTAYTIGWEHNIDKLYKPILKENLMAKFIFYFGLLF